MGSSKSTSGGGGGGGKKTKTTTGTTKPGTSGGFKPVEGSSNLKQAAKPKPEPKKSVSKAKKTPVQTYESFKTPEGRTAAVERQKAILASTRTTTGAFANQEKDLKKAGYTLSADKSTVLKDGKTVAGVTSTGGLFSGSKEVSNIIKSSQPKTVDQTKPMSKEEREKLRETTSLETMGRLEQLDEPSKAREAEIQKALNYGRGVQPAPTVLDPTRIVASTPTLSELGGDIKRGLVGGTAPSVPYLKKGYQPEPVKGLIPTVIDAAATGALSPTLSIFNAIRGNKFFTSKDDSQTTTTTTTPETTTEFAESEAEAERKRKLAGSLVSSATKGRSLFQIKGRTISGGMA